MKITFKNKTEKRAFIFATILIFVIFGCIAISAYQTIGWSWIILIVFPFAPFILTLSNITDHHLK